jgi:hypothetical protein
MSESRQILAAMVVGLAAGLALPAVAQEPHRPAPPPLPSHDGGKGVVRAEQGPIAPPKQIDLRLLGSDTRLPLPGIQVEVTNGYGREQKKFGPFTTDKTGTARVSLPPAFYSLHLKSEKELPYLAVEELWNKQSRGPSPDLGLYVTDSGVEKWLGGKRRTEGCEPRAGPEGAPCVTYTLLPACELLLRAVDAETGKGLAGAEFYTENAVGEEWGHPIHGENLGSHFIPDGKQLGAEVNRTDKDGNFRRLVGANAGFKYGVQEAPAGYEEVAPCPEVEIAIVYGQSRAEHAFKFRRVPKPAPALFADPIPRYTKNQWQCHSPREQSHETVPGCCRRPCGDRGDPTSGRRRGTGEPL